MSGKAVRGASCIRRWTLGQLGGLRGRWRRGRGLLSRQHKRGLCGRQRGLAWWEGGGREKGGRRRDVLE